MVLVIKTDGVLCGETAPVTVKTKKLMRPEKAESKAEVRTAFGNIEMTICKAATPGAVKAGTAAKNVELARRGPFGIRDASRRIMSRARSITTFTP